MTNLADVSRSTGNPLDILIEHDNWATQRMLDTCSTLAEAQLHQRFEIGPGSLHDTLAHTIGAMQRWTAVLRDRKFPATPRFEETRHSLADLRAAHRQATADFAREARAAKLDEMIPFERGAERMTVSAGGVITHVTTHGMYHRAQCMNMFRRLGVSPLPHSSVTEWMRQSPTNR